VLHETSKPKRFHESSEFLSKILVSCLLGMRESTAMAAGQFGRRGYSVLGGCRLHEGQTIPARKLSADPATYTAGEQYYTNILKICTAPNTWEGSGGGGIPHFSGATAMTSSSALSINSVVVG
jgi:hypothetical protein